ncbi:transposase family protein [Leucobacter coleopterorum]|uniref:Transposase family protein n=1 Tax=Leucobacter coleopterorum TaxID=2714933 RepID=A0ABX6JZB1_9MICO|nr:transposase family protein [Leucobacter coleopterorum]
MTPAPVDHVKRKFRAENPNEVWVTDVTEFAGPDGKVYLSPMIDCFDGKVVAWNTLRSPSKALTQGMLADAISTLPAAYREELRDDATAAMLAVHTDRGGHYRGAEWIEKMNSAGLTRSMGRKGKSGDNAACEGFFGRMKTEMFYGRVWGTWPRSKPRSSSTCIFITTNASRPGLVVPPSPSIVPQ